MSMTEDELAAQLEEDLKAISLGDEDATKRLASYIANRVANTDAAAAQSLEEQRAQRYLAAEQAHRRFLCAYGGALKKHPDIVSDDEAYEYWKKVDTQLATQNPQMDPVERLDMGADIVRARLGPEDERDTKGWIAERRRRADPLSAQKEAINFNEELGNDDEEAQRHHEEIQEMIEGRRQQQQELAERAIAMRNAERPRVRRYSDQ